MDSEGAKELQSEEDMEQEVSSDKDEDSEPEEEDAAEEDEEEMAEMQDRGDLRDVEVWNGFISGAGLAAEEEALLDWTPGDPVTPQYVLRLPGYTDGEDTSLFVCFCSLTAIFSLLYCYGLCVQTTCAPQKTISTILASHDSK